MIQPGQRRISKLGALRVLECRCDAAQLAIPLPAPVKCSFCKLCKIPENKSCKGTKEGS